MNKVFLSGRITSDISRFGTDSKGGVLPPLPERSLGLDL